MLHYQLRSGSGGWRRQKSAKFSESTSSFIEGALGSTFRAAAPGGGSRDPEPSPGWVNPGRGHSRARQYFHLGVPFVESGTARAGKAEMRALLGHNASHNTFIPPGTAAANDKGRSSNRCTESTRLHIDTTSNNNIILYDNAA